MKPFGKLTIRRRQGSDDLLDFCRGRLTISPKPKDARALVDDWYAWDRGTPLARGKNKKNRAGYVNRVRNFLVTQETAGRLREVDRKGNRGAKRYVAIKGAWPKIHREELYKY